MVGEGTGRRGVLKTSTSAAAALTVLAVAPELSWGKTGSMATSQFSTAPSQKAAKIDPKTAITNLIAAQDELKDALLLAKKNDIASLRRFIDDDSTSIASFEVSATSLLSSKLLDSDDKKAIGTIRRYGPGADVLIMFGGAGE